MLHLTLYAFYSRLYETTLVDEVPMRLNAKWTTKSKRAKPGQLIAHRQIFNRYHQYTWVKQRSNISCRHSSLDVKLTFVPNRKVQEK